jgi:hypothetical protein
MRLSDHRAAAALRARTFLSAALRLVALVLAAGLVVFVTRYGVTDPHTAPADLATSVTR